MVKGWFLVAEVPVFGTGTRPLSRGTPLPRVGSMLSRPIPASCSREVVNDLSPMSSHDIETSLVELLMTCIHDPPLPEFVIFEPKLLEATICSSSRSNCARSVAGMIERTCSMMRLRSICHVPFVVAPAKSVELGY